MLTIEQLRARAKFWREKAVEAKWESVSIAQDMLQNADAFDELAANREAQPVALIDRRPAASGSICWQNGGKDLPHGTELFTATPAPANAQSVAWEMRYWNSGHGCWHDWERITAEQHAEMSVQHAADNDYEFRVLYDAPPAPAVPEKCPEHVRSLMNIHADDLFDDADAQEIWNACRAAMLAQPVSSGYKLPDGWIACSERMPKDGDVVLVFQEGGIIFCAEVDDGEFYPDEFPRVPTQGREITYWMPLPAAPEGGNG